MNQTLRSVAAQWRMPFSTTIAFLGQATGNTRQWRGKTMLLQLGIPLSLQSDSLSTHIEPYTSTMVDWNQRQTAEYNICICKVQILQLRTQEEAFFNSSTICSLLFLAYLKFKTRNMASKSRISMLIGYPMITHIPFKSTWQSTGKAILMPQAAHFSITFLSKRKIVSLSSGFSYKAMHGKLWKKKHQGFKF